MARNGRVRLENLVVQKVVHERTGTSRIVAVKNNYTVTIERVGQFPDDMHVRPDGEIDLLLEYDPK